MYRKPNALPFDAKLIFSFLSHCLFLCFVPVDLISQCLPSQQLRSHIGQCSPSRVCQRFKGLKSVPHPQLFLSLFWVRDTRKSSEISPVVFSPGFARWNGNIVLFGRELAKQVSLKGPYWTQRLWFFREVGEGRLLCSGLQPFHTVCLLLILSRWQAWDLVTHISE